MLIVIMLRQRLDRLPRQPQARMHEQPICQSAAILEERLNTPTGVPYVCLSDFHEPFSFVSCVLLVWTTGELRTRPRAIKHDMWHYLVHTSLARLLTMSPVFNRLAPYQAACCCKHERAGSNQ